MYVLMFAPSVGGVNIFMGWAYEFDESGEPGTEKGQ